MIVRAPGNIDNHNNSTLPDRAALLLLSYPNHKSRAPLDTDENFVKAHQSGRCVSIACLSRGVEDQNPGRFTLHHHSAGILAPHQPSIRLSTTGHNASMWTSSLLPDARVLIQGHDLAQADQGHPRAALDKGDLWIANVMPQHPAGVLADRSSFVGWSRVALPTSWPPQPWPRLSACDGSGPHTACEILHPTELHSAPLPPIAPQLSTDRRRRPIQGGGNCRRPETQLQLSLNVNPLR